MGTSCHSTRPADSQNPSRDAETLCSVMLGLSLGGTWRIQRHSLNSSAVCGFEPLDAFANGVGTTCQWEGRAESRNLSRDAKPRAAALARVELSLTLGGVWHNQCHSLNFHAVKGFERPFTSQHGV